MKYSETCHCCHHTVTAYIHRLNAGMVEALKQLVDHYSRHRRRVNLQKDLNLTKNQYNNFQKLQYFRLVHRDTGGWVPTSGGTRFIQGEIGCPDVVATMGKEVLSWWHKAWDTHGAVTKTVYVTDFLDTRYKGKEEYKEERRTTTLNLFNI